MLYFLTRQSHSSSDAACPLMDQPSFTPLSAAHSQQPSLISKAWWNSWWHYYYLWQLAFRCIFAIWSGFATESKSSTGGKLHCMMTKPPRHKTHSSRPKFSTLLFKGPIVWLPKRKPILWLVGVSVLSNEGDQSMHFDTWEALCPRETEHWEGWHFLME